MTWDMRLFLFTWDYSYSQIPRFFKTVHLPLTNTPSSLCSTSIIRFFCILKIGQLNICPFDFLDFLEGVHPVLLSVVEIDEPNAIASNPADISKCHCCFSWMWKLPWLFKIGRLKFLFCVISVIQPDWLIESNFQLVWSGMVFSLSTLHGWIQDWPLNVNVPNNYKSIHAGALMGSWYILRHKINKEGAINKLHKDPNCVQKLQ